MGGVEAITLYRSLLRARRKCFTGDAHMLGESLKHIRGAFEANRSVSDPAALRQHITDGHDAIRVLTQELVQARLNERGNYEVQLDKEFAGATLEEPSLKGH